MPLTCRKTSVRSSAAQWNLDALVETGAGDPVPCFLSVVSSWCTLQAPSSAEGEKLLAAACAVLGPPDSPPQIVKGGACGGEEEDAPFPFTGAMVSVTWKFPRKERDAFLDKVAGLFGAGAVLR